VLRLALLLHQLVRGTQYKQCNAAGEQKKEIATLVRI
jgi:hypothetical protein